MKQARELFQQAVTAAKAGEPARARDLFERVTREHPEIPQAWMWRAHVAASPEERVEHLRRAYELEPQNPRTQTGLVKALVEAGIARAKQSAKAEAKSFFTEATELEPNHEAAWLWLASLADTAADRLLCVDKVLAKNPTHPNALAWKAELEKLNVSATEKDPWAVAVLVVDDSLTVRSLVKRTLTRRGCEVMMAVDAEEARTRLAEKTPDLIFLDIDLPDTDGFELCKIIKARPETRDVPVLMLSGKDSAFDKLRGRMVGAEDHISKPFRPDDLVQALARFIPQRSTDR